VAVAVGDKLCVGPFPMTVPEHVPIYQNQSAEVPKIPPVIPRVVNCPSQIIPGLDVADNGAMELVFTSISLLTQPVVLHTFSALT